MVTLKIRNCFTKNICMVEEYVSKKEAKEALINKYFDRMNCEYIIEGLTDTKWRVF